MQEIDLQAEVLQRLIFDNIINVVNTSDRMVRTPSLEMEWFTCEYLKWNGLHEIISNGMVCK